MTKTRYALWIGASGVVLGALWYALQLLFAETLYTERGSPAYHFAITPLVKQLPRYAILEGDEAQYSSSSSVPAYDGVSYCTTAVPDQIYRFFGRHFSQRGFLAEQHEWGQSYTSRTEQVRLSIADTGICRTQVRLRHYTVH